MTLMTGRNTSFLHDSGTSCAKAGAERHSEGTIQTELLLVYSILSLRNLGLPQDVEERKKQPTPLQY